MTAIQMTPPMPSFLKLLAHELRWQLVSALAHGDRRGQELAGLLGRPQNLVSYHLKRLRQARLVTEHRSAADRRDIYYSLRLDEMQSLFFASGQALHPALGQTAGAPLAAPDVAVGGAPTRVLFLCTHNSARSQMAEAITRHLGKGEVEVYSAGNEPSEVNPLAIETMRRRGISIDGQRSKHLSEFIGQRFDYVVTVCDVARESCPVFPGSPERIHWSFPDPAAVTEAKARRRAFDRTATELTTRINYLLLVIRRQRSGGKQTGR